MHLWNRETDAGNFADCLSQKTDHIFPMPFCSQNLHLEDNRNKFLEMLMDEKAFKRQSDISQLQNLIPEFPGAKKEFAFPYFPHKRYDHAKMTGIMASFVSDKMSTMDEAVKIEFIIACLYHDVATIAGGDAIRCLSELLCEEKNFTSCMVHHGLDLKFQKLFNFNISKTQQYIFGKGRNGKLLDFLDKISYTILDYHHFQSYAPKVLKDFVNKYPTFGDIWLDLNLDSNGQPYFSDPDRLFNFLKIRALMFVWLYKNPACRKIEQVITKETTKLIFEGKITYNDLKKETDRWLSLKLEENGCFIRSSMLSDTICWQKFGNQQDCERFENTLNERLIRTEQIQAFSTGLDYPIKNNGKLVPLEDTLTPSKIDELKRLSTYRSGWYVYFYKEN